MSKKTLLALAFVAIAMPTAAFGQIGIAARGGTLGVGGEVAIGLGSRLQIRGGYGISKYHYEGTFSDKQYTVDFPPAIWNAGVDLFLAGGFHVSAGLVNRPKFDLTGSYAGTTTIGNRTFTGTVNVVGDMTNEKETGPYAGIGFGRTSKKGFGLTLDLGVAQLGEGAIHITSATCTQSNGTACPQQPSRADMDAEAAKANADIGTFLKFHPIISLGLHIGL